MKMKRVRIMGEPYEVDYVGYKEYRGVRRYVADTEHKVIKIDSAMSIETQKLMLFRALVDVICVKKNMPLTPYEKFELADGLSQVSNINVYLCAI